MISGPSIPCGSPAPTRSRGIPRATPLLAAASLLLSCARGAGAQDTQITLAPASQSTTSPTLSYQTDVCANTGQQLTSIPNVVRVLLDGVQQGPSGNQLVWITGCQTAWRVTGIVALIPGNANVLSVSAWDSEGVLHASTAATYRYLYIRPFIGPVEGSIGIPPASPGVAYFTVKNDGNTTGSISLSTSCSGRVASCGAPSSSLVTLDSAQSTTISVAFTTALAGGLGTVVLTGVGADPSAFSASQQVAVSVPDPVAFIVVNPKGQSAGDIAASQTSPHTFMVSSVSANYTETVTVSASCPPPSGHPEVSCSVNGSSSIQLRPQTNAFVEVDLLAPNSAGVSGEIRLTATVDGTTVSDMGSMTYATVTSGDNAFFLSTNAGSDVLLRKPTAPW